MLSAHHSCEGFQATSANGPPNNILYSFNPRTQEPYVIPFPYLDKSEFGHVPSCKIDQAGKEPHFALLDVHLNVLESHYSP